VRRLVRDVDTTLARAVTLLAATIACVVTVSLPAAYFLSGHATRQAEIDAEARLAAATVSQLASSSPELWVYENARIRGLIAVLGPPLEAERRIVMSRTGESVVDHGDQPQWPVMTAVSPVYDSGRVVGRMEIQRSMRPLLLGTAVVATLAAMLAAGAFAALRSMPLRLLHRALERSAHLATHDVLTGLPNRALFRDRVERALNWLRREGTSLAVLYLDLDHFKDVNDTLGHTAGDRLLVDVAARLRSCTRETDTLARLGGDEFAVLQSGARTLADTELLAQRLVAALEQTFNLDGMLIAVGVSIGIAVRNATDQSDTDAGILLQEADVALYRAKAEGRATYRFFAAEMNQRLLAKRSLEAELLEACERGQFRLHYQPQFDLTEHRIVGAEALIRWHHPLRGEILPETFIPLTEETALISRIGEWVLQEACRQAALWPDLGCMAVNVSPVQFRRPGFCEQVERALDRSGISPKRLEIEITEGVLLHETEETLATLRRLRALGVSIAMDDFGTGYSSLGYLQKFHFDKLKIDRSFVSALQTDTQAAPIVRAVVRMSHAMGIRVLAEGVEHAEQASALHDEGCEEAQGFLFGRALPATQFRDLLAQSTLRLPQHEPAPA